MMPFRNRLRGARSTVSSAWTGFAQGFAEARISERAKVVSVSIGGAIGVAGALIWLT
jgi:hypothetical protein